jgi:hypothetical protein
MTVVVKMTIKHVSQQLNVVMRDSKPLLMTDVVKMRLKKECEGRKAENDKAFELWAYMVILGSILKGV